MTTKKIEPSNGGKVKRARAKPAMRIQADELARIVAECFVLCPDVPVVTGLDGQPVMFKDRGKIYVPLTFRIPAEDVIRLLSGASWEGEATATLVMD